MFSPSRFPGNAREYRRFCGFVNEEMFFVKFLDLSGSLTDVSNRASRAAEKVKIKQALELSNWNKTQAAEMLEVSYKTLLNKVKEYGLE